jgi:hypothetical protein
MFHEILLAPFAQTSRLRSPDVARLPFVGGSMHTVMTPLWIPGVATLSAEATDATPTHETATAASNSHLFPFEFSISGLLVLYVDERSLLRSCSDDPIGGSVRTHSSARSTAALPPCGRGDVSTTVHGVPDRPWSRLRRANASLRASPPPLSQSQLVDPTVFAWGCVRIARRG